MRMLAALMLLQTSASIVMLLPNVLLAMSLTSTFFWTNDLMQKTGR